MGTAPGAAATEFPQPDSDSMGPPCLQNMPLDALVNVIDTLQKRIATHRQSLQDSETRTRMALIDPLLTALGWDVSDLSLVTPEYSVGKGRADYALNGSGNEPVAIVEAKRLNHPLDDQEFMQMLNYTNIGGVKYAAVTDGNVWELYDVFKPARLADRRLLSLKMVNTPTHKLALGMLLLWRPNLASGAPIAAQVPVLKTRLEPATTEAPHPRVDTPLSQTSVAQYCVDGKTWLKCRNSTLLMISIVEWCAQQHVHGADDYYENLSRARFGKRPILVRERVTEMEKKCYSKEKINGWYVFNNLPNQAKKQMIDEILKACIRENGTSPVQGQDLQVKMPNA